MADRPTLTGKIFSRNFTTDPPETESVSKELNNKIPQLNKGPDAKVAGKQLPPRPLGAPPTSPRLQSPGGTSPPLVTSPRQQPRISADDAKTYLENWVKHEFSSGAVASKLRSGQRIDNVFRENPSLELNGKAYSIKEFIEGYFGAILPQSQIGRAWAGCQQKVSELIQQQKLKELDRGKMVLTAAAKQVADELIDTIRGREQSLASSALPPEVQEFLLYADALVKTTCEKMQIGAEATETAREEALIGLLFTRVLSVTWGEEMRGGSDVALFLGRVNSSLNRSSQAFTASIMDSTDGNRGARRMQMRMSKVAHSRKKRKNTDAADNPNPLLDKARKNQRKNQLIKEVIAGLPSASDPAQTKALRGRLQEACKAQPDISLQELEKAAQRFLTAEASDSASGGQVSPGSESPPEKSS